VDAPSPATDAPKQAKAPSKDGVTAQLIKKQMAEIEKEINRQVQNKNLKMVRECHSAH
jgi:hypothetical protein